MSYLDVVNRIINRMALEMCYGKEPEKVLSELLEDGWEEREAKQLLRAANWLKNCNES